MDIVPNQSWVIVTLNQPVQWARTTDEVWYLNPNRRYILNANQLEHLKPFISSTSELKGSRHHRPLDSGSQLNGAKILIERYRDRGVGDTLFLSAVLQYLADMSGNTATLDVYSLANRADALVGHPGLKYGPLHGPVHYDDLPNYDCHWFIDHVTEHTEEPDQPNVYDSLYTQLGLNPADIDPRYKRPVLRFGQEDIRNLNQTYEGIYRNYQLDLRRTPYYVIAPATVSSLRALPYRTFIDLARELAKRRPVLFVGLASGQLPSSDMPFGDFFNQLNDTCKQHPNRIINMMGPHTPFRQVAGLAGRSNCFIGLDSGLLYAAQALRAPAVSIWGTHHPGVRLGYDRAYMDLAIHKTSACPAAPCYAFRAWPHERCPEGQAQTVCACLKDVTVEDLLAKVELAEKLITSR